MYIYGVEYIHNIYKNQTVLDSNLVYIYGVEYIHNV